LLAGLGLGQAGGLHIVMRTLLEEGMAARLPRSA